MTSALSLPSRSAPGTQSPAAIIRLSEIAMTYRMGTSDTRALAGISLEIAEGEYVAVTGPSGCGKSTLLSILGLLDPPTSGTYQLKGTATEKLSAREHAKQRNLLIGFVFQSFNLIEELSALENVALPLTYRAGVSASQRLARARIALAKVGLEDREAHLPSELSGGQQQRVAIARAIVGDPPLLLCDEPTGNLDTNAGRQIRQLLGELHQAGATIVLVTHDDAHVRDATRVVRLLDGHVIDDSRAVERTQADVA